MEKTIDQYLGKLEVLEDDVDAYIEKVVSSLDIKDVIADPIAALGEVIELIQEELEEGYHEKAFKIGQKFAGDIVENAKSRSQKQD